MFQLEPKAEYMDVLERMMLNTNLAGFSLDGKKFFYENMLRRAKKLDYELIWPLTRSEYILSYCCPPNLARTVAQASEYAYMLSGDCIWSGMYGASEAYIQLENGAEFTLVQDTEYPFDGELHFTAKNIKTAKKFSLCLRIPHWSKAGKLVVNGEEVILTKEDAGSYREIIVEDPGNMDVHLSLNMGVRFTVANSMVEETAGQAAIERGPLVYCAESVDTEAETLDDIYLDLNAVFRPVDFEIAGKTIKALETEQYCIDRSDFDRNVLYQELRYTGMSKKYMRFIPYFAWDNRDYGEMRIWFPLHYS